MTDILDLPGWEVIAKTTEDGTDVLAARYLPQPEACLKCGTIGELYRHGTKVVEYLDSPMRGSPARLRATVQRFRCRSCSETFLQPLGGIQPERRMTERCANFIQARCLRDTFTRLAEDVGCDDKTVRNLASEYIERLQGAYKPVLPQYLGIDETTIDGKLRLVLTDLGKRQPVDMVDARDQGKLATWLNHFRERGHVRGVSIDMWRPYLRTVHQLLPGVPVVVDKFHIVRMATDAMEDVRIRLQKTRKKAVRADWLRSKAVLRMRASKLNDKQRLNRDGWTLNEPELGEAYRLKEAFYDLYDLPKDEAVAAFDAFPGQVPPILKKEFRPLLTAMKNWRTEILAFFDHRITNAYTEALNGVAKTINRQGRGYSFEVLRARLLFGKKAKAQELPWTLATAYLAVDEVMQMVRREQDGRCQSCGIELGRSKKTFPHLAVIVRGKERKRILICGLCFEGFHTRSLSRTFVPSTQ
jgi:transposase